MVKAFPIAFRHVASWRYQRTLQFLRFLAAAEIIETDLGCSTRNLEVF